MKKLINCLLACGIWSAVLIRFESLGAVFSDDAWIVTWSIIASAVIANKE